MILDFYTCDINNDYDICWQKKILYICHCWTISAPFVLVIKTEIPRQSKNQTFLHVVVVILAVPYKELMHHQKKTTEQIVPVTNVIKGLKLREKGMLSGFVLTEGDKESTKREERRLGLTQREEREEWGSD